MDVGGDINKPQSCEHLVPGRKKPALQPSSEAPREPEDPCSLGAVTVGRWSMGEKPSVYGPNNLSTNLALIESMSKQSMQTTHNKPRRWKTFDKELCSNHVGGVIPWQPGQMVTPQSHLWQVDAPRCTELIAPQEFVHHVCCLYGYRLM